MINLGNCRHLFPPGFAKKELASHRVSRLSSNSIPPVLVCFAIDQRQSRSASDQDIVDSTHRQVQLASSGSTDKVVTVSITCCGPRTCKLELGCIPGDQPPLSGPGGMLV